MKLLFPNGEHPQVLLGQGVHQIGRAEDAAVSLNDESIALNHAEVLREGESLSIKLLAAEGGLKINGKAVPEGDYVPFKPGDLLEIGTIHARLVAIEKAGTAPAAPRPAAVDDSGATRVRMAIPKYVLRGVSGAAFGKLYPITAQQVIGRQADCDITIASEEISRRHALVRPVPAGLQVEDLESSNGTYINGKRIQQGVLRPGEELRLDNIRFLLVAPGAEIPNSSRLAKENQRAPAKKGGRTPWIVAAIVVLAAAGAAAYYFLR